MGLELPRVASRAGVRIGKERKRGCLYCCEARSVRARLVSPVVVSALRRSEVGKLLHVKFPKTSRAERIAL